LPGGWTWILDPIDGTTNFSEAGREYAISLALYVDGEPELALVLDCERDRIYTAVAGRGARLDGRLLPKRADPSAAASPGTSHREHPLRSAILDASLNTLLNMGKRGADLEFLNRELRAHRSSGCASLNLCRIAEAGLDAYVSSKLRLWDWAAGSLILKECACPFWIGASPDPSPCITDKRFFLAARNEALGKELLALIES
jgi:myo-inositol-1(or 4)-monophosphatase